MRYEGYPNDFLDGHQILYTVRGQFQDITLARVVLGVGTLIGRAVFVLHRELATSITDTEDGASTCLESFGSHRSGLGLPDVELRNPIDL